MVAVQVLLPPRAALHQRVRQVLHLPPRAALPVRRPPRVLRHRPQAPRVLHPLRVHQHHLRLARRHPAPPPSPLAAPRVPHRHRPSLLPALRQAVQAVRSLPPLAQARPHPRVQVFLPVPHRHLALPPPRVRLRALAAPPVLVQVPVVHLLVRYLQAPPLHLVRVRVHLPQVVHLHPQALVVHPVVRHHRALPVHHPAPLAPVQAPPRVAPRVLVPPSPRLPGLILFLIV